MALSLRGGHSSSSGDKVAPFLNRLVNCGVGHKVMPGVTLRGDLLPATEYEKHVEGEQWAKMIHDRTKDLVLTFGEEDVRVFKRVGPQQKKGNLPSHISTGVPRPQDDDGDGDQAILVDAAHTALLSDPSEAPTAPVDAASSRGGPSSSSTAKPGGGDRHDVTGLATIGDPSVFTSLVPPRCVIERAKEVERLQREDEVKAERQRRIDAESKLLAATGNTGTSSRPTPSESSHPAGHSQATTTTPQGQYLASDARARRGESKGALLPLKKATLAKVDQATLDPATAYTSHTQHGAPPTFIPPRVFAQLITRRCREADPAAAHAERVKAEQLKAIQEGNRNAKPRRRHHRTGCIHHRLSTNTLARSMVRERTFPHSALKRSVLRLRQAVHGSPSSSVVDEDASGNPDSCFLLPDVSVIDAGSPGAGLDVTTRSVTLGNNVGMVEGAGLGNSFANSRGEEGGDGSVEGVDVFAMTRPNGVGLLDRSRTPNLEPFITDDVEGALSRCDCTDRSSTDDEVPLRIQLRDAKRVLRKKASVGHIKHSRTGSNSNTTTVDDVDPNHHHGEEPLMADNASEALHQWTMGFKQTKVVAGVRLESRLGTRETHRSFVCDERRHLHLVATAAEHCGEEFFVSNRCRSTTPMNASMWAPVHSAIEGDRRYLALTQTKYTDFCSFCTAKRFPSNELEMNFMDDLRSRCVGDGSSRPASVMYNTITTASAISPNRSRASSPALGGVAQQRPNTGVTFPNPTNRGQHQQHGRSPSIVDLELTGADMADQALTQITVTGNSKPPLRRGVIGGGRVGPRKRLPSTTPTDPSILASHDPPTPTDGGLLSGGRRPSRVATAMSLSDTHRAGGGVYSGSNSNPQSRSLFLSSAKDRNRGDTWAIEAPKEVRILSETTALELLERHGQMLLSTRRGVIVANQLREMCKLSPKDFFQVVQRHEVEWGPYIPEVGHLRKKLQA